MSPAHIVPQQVVVRFHPLCKIVAISKIFASTIFEEDQKKYFFSCRSEVFRTSVHVVILLRSHLFDSRFSLGRTPFTMAIHRGYAGRVESRQMARRPHRCSGSLGVVGYENDTFRYRAIHGRAQSAGECHPGVPQAHWIEIDVTAPLQKNRNLLQFNRLQRRRPSRTIDRLPLTKTTISERFYEARRKRSASRHRNASASDHFAEPVSAMVFHRANAVVFEGNMMLWRELTGHKNRN